MRGKHLLDRLAVVSYCLSLIGIAGMTLQPYNYQQSKG
jgi:hypothetical protein